MSLSRRADTWLFSCACLAYLILAFLPSVAPLNDTDVPIEVWQHVLDTEPNRHTEELAKISEQEGILTRTFFSDAHRLAAKVLKRWMEAAGMLSWIDAVGNVHGYVNGTDPDAPEVLIGSHYDTVVDAGKYDGSLGVILAIAACKALLLEALHRDGHLDTLLLGHGSHGGAWHASPDGELTVPAAMVSALLPSPVHVVGFSDEEGIRFKSTFLGSRALAGTFHKHKQLTARDSNGQSFGQLLASLGHDDPNEAVAALALPPQKVKQYVEFHVEQGPVLESQGVPLGVVVGIAGQTWLSVSVKGAQGHAGTVPMDMRHDPMAAAAEAISMLESTCRGDPVTRLGTEEEADAVLVPTQHLRCTVGHMKLHPGQINSIPGWANFTADVRCRSDDFRAATLTTIKRRLELICKRRGVNCTVETTHDAQAVHSDQGVVNKLRAAILSAQPLLEHMLPAERPDGITSKAVRVHVDNQADPVYTALTVEGPSRPGLLSSLTAALSDLGLDIGRANVDGDEQRIRDTFHVVTSSSSGSSSGAKLTDARQISKVRSTLEALLRAGQESAAGAGHTCEKGSGGARCDAAADAVAAAAVAKPRSAVGQHEVPSMLSGAGHDAMAMADIAPIGMVFVRSLNGGVSHSSAELTAPADIAAAATALATFLEADVLDGAEHEAAAAFGFRTIADLEEAEQQGAAEDGDVATNAPEDPKADISREQLDDSSEHYEL